ncbi:hypothetical protein [Agaribacterium sp. ZY112]|uniref:hypothetical protein n=1 Tax=Agaribacterium sp. ZY112 TaxID=3233574 RepID=UPI003525404B
MNSRPLWIAVTVLICLLFSFNQVDAQQNKTPYQSKLQLKIATNVSTIERHKINNKRDFCNELAKQDNLDRAAVELLLICMSLKMEGVEAELELIPSPTYGRAIQMLQDGKAHIAAQSLWASDINPELIHLTEATIRLGEFEKGIYTTKNHPLQQQKGQHYPLNNYLGVTLRSWHHDWRILNELTPSSISTIRYDSMIKMLSVGRGDFTLHEFPNNDELVVRYSGVDLYPLQGVKIVIHDIRAFGISLKAPSSERLIHIMNNGVHKMREQGLIREIYENNGFINQQTNGWAILNPIEKTDKSPNKAGALQ